MAKWVVFFFIVLSCITLMGCWDRHDLEELAYVIAIGIDQSEGYGMSITYQIANPEAGEPKGGTDEAASDIITINAPDFLSARDMLVSFVSREVVFTHMKVLIVSEDIAREERFIDYIKPAVREREFDRRLTFIVCREKAADYLRNNKPTLETRPHKFFELMKDRWEETGLIPDSTLQEFLHTLEEDTGVFLATYSTTEEVTTEKEGMEDRYVAGEIEKEGGNPVQTIGSAVIKEGTMIGTMDGEETRMALLLRPHIEASQMIVTYEDPIAKGKHITARVLNEKRTRVNVNTNQDYPIIDVEVPVMLEILAITSHIDYIEDLEKQAQLKRHIEEKYKEVAGNFIRKTQQQFQGDPFRWGLMARKNFLTLQEYWEYDWMKKYPDAQVNLKVNVEVTEYGKQLRPPNIELIKD
ncbi:Ger(x)C family spore germination protein [Alkalihalobacterium alkalinitrilicum]|uniref:Ger(x)C family spore germination protein n=1 Tax=Alkalihalobacterium alkalinitrilicum TaxID=427920 RepID=UPI000994FF20|nr:Ger(x)C family spore germination protein [Alkalihalobacterium alkalinitrilicum]